MWHGQAAEEDRGKSGEERRWNLVATAGLARPGLAQRADGL